jgi:hypothetical protein
MMKRNAQANSPDATLRRRRWQFTLRSLALGIVLVCGLLAAWSKFGEPYRKEQQVIGRFASLRLSIGKQLYGPKWLQRVLGSHAPMHVMSIEGEMSDEDITQLRLLPELYELLLRNGERHVSDAGVKDIGALTSLHRLAIASPKITDDGVSHLAGLANLRHLELPHQISDAAMIHLHGLTSLETLISAAQTPPQQKIIAALEEMTDADFADQPLVDVIDYIQFRHDIAIDGRELVRAKRSLDVPITCKQRGVLLFAALRQILEPHGFDQTLGPNRLLLTTRDAIEAARPQLTELCHVLPRLTTTIVDWDLPSFGPAPASDEERAIESLAQLARIDVDKFGSVRAVRLAGSSQAGDDALEDVAELKQLQELVLAGCRVTDHGLSLLTGLDSLVTLDLTGTNIGDEGVAAVASLRALRDLRLDDTRVTDMGVAATAKLRKLARLSLARTRITGNGLAHLKNLLHLEWLRLDGIGDEDLAGVEGFAHLRALFLTGPRVADEGMMCVARLPLLDHLQLANTSVTSEGLRQLATLPALKSLTWTGIAFEATDFASLAELSRLSQLVITGPAVTDESLATLPELSNLEFLSLEGDPITDAGFDHLPPLSALRSINLFRTPVTSNGVAKLQRRFPKLAVLDAHGNRLVALEK